MRWLLAAVAASFASASVPAAISVDAAVPRGEGRSRKKSSERGQAQSAPVLATLAQTHTGDRVVLDSDNPTPERFDALLSDRATGQTLALSPALLPLLRDVARGHPGARIELVSGFRSPKLNEMLRKKGHHVASHSQHTLGHAVDFRVVAGGDETGCSPVIVERELRAMGWKGGVGVYLKKSDWFVHADVGPERRWDGQ